METTIASLAKALEANPELSIFLPSETVKMASCTLVRTMIGNMPFEASDLMKRIGVDFGSRKGIRHPDLETLRIAESILAGATDEDAGVVEDDDWRDNIETLRRVFALALIANDLEPLPADQARPNLARVMERMPA